MKIKKNDNVIVVVGKDKGKTGKVLHVFSDIGKVTVEGINVKKRHKKSRQSNQPGSIIEISNPIDISNVMLIDPASKKPTRVAFKDINGKKVRVASKSGQEIK